VSLILNGDRRVHLPVPGVLHGQRDRLAFAVRLRGEHDAGRPDWSVPFSNTVAAGFGSSGALTLETSGSSFHRASEASAVAASCVAACV
jgi:hypothetical protein